MARAYITYTEGTDAVSTTYVEHLTERRFLAVTVTPDDTGIEMPNELR